MGRFKMFLQGIQNHLEGHGLKTIALSNATLCTVLIIFVSASLENRNKYFYKLFERYVHSTDSTNYELHLYF